MPVILMLSAYFRTKNKENVFSFVCDYFISDFKFSHYLVNNVPGTQFLSVVNNIDICPLTDNFVGTHSL